jgi:hypothetical protein
VSLVRFRAPLNRIIRLNTNGSIDASFVTGAGFNDNVTALAIQPDGKIIIGGVLQCIKA